MKIAGFDIETIPPQKLPEGCMPVFDESEVALRNRTKPDAIEKKIAEDKLKFEAGMVKKMSLHPWLCQVCAFAGILFDTETRSIEQEVKILFHNGQFAGGDPNIKDFESEYQLIYEAWGFLNTAISAGTSLLSFNGIRFDLPVLMARAMAQDVPVSFPRYQKLIQNYGRSSRYHYDLMGILSDWDKSRWKKLDFFLDLFGIKRTVTDMDGSQVYDVWKERNFVKLMNYCYDDTLSLIHLFERVESWVKVPKDQFEKKEQIVMA